MGAISFLELAAATEKAFGFLLARGYRVEGIEFLAPASFRGGFVLTLKGPVTVTLDYTEMQFTASCEGTELFGVKHHQGFAGNQFSPEHLLENLPAIAAQVNTQLSEGSRNAV